MAQRTKEEGIVLRFPRIQFTDVITVLGRPLDLFRHHKIRGPYYAVATAGIIFSFPSILVVVLLLISVPTMLL